MRNNKKQEYIAPVADVLMCCCESVVCLSNVSTEQYYKGSNVTDMFTTDLFDE